MCGRSSPKVVRSGTAAAALAVVLVLLLPPSTARASPATDLGAEVVLRALSLLGVSYRFGGNTPETGLDCSGLVRLVFSDAIAMTLPRRSEEMSRLGAAVSPTELQPGDLVFFNTLRRTFSHVGIYIGNGQFVHAPATGGSIRVERIGASYWTRRFDGARRLIPTDAGAASVVARASDAAGSAARKTAAEPRTRALVARTAPALPALPVADRDYPVN